MKNIVTDAADEYGIKWSYDPVFMDLSEEYVGERHISDMNEDQMRKMVEFIHENHYIFTKKMKKESAGKPAEPLKQNEDYGDFLDKVRERLKKLKKSKRGRNRRKS